MRKHCYIVSLLHCFIVLALCGGVVFAQTPESPQSPQSTPTTSSTQIDEEKVQEIRDQVQEKVQEKINQIKEKGKRRAYVGKILALDGLNITIETKRGERAVTIDKDAKIIGPKRQSFEPEDLEVEDLIICMGYVGSENLSAESADNMIAKRIVVIPQPPNPPLPRRVVFGQVTEIDEKSLILSLIHHSLRSNSTLRVETASKTKVTKKLEEEIQKVDFDKIQVNDRLVAIGTWDEDEEILTAKLIHVIPGKAEGQGE